MKQFSSAAVIRHSGEIFDTAQFGPVLITKYRKPKFVIMNIEHYERLVKGRDGREVFAHDTVPEDVRQEMLTGIEGELAHD